MEPDRMEVPATDVARQARNLLHGTCDPFIAAHCQRSYRFGLLLAERDGCEIDREVLYVGTLLHDLGLSRHYEGPERFEIRGANAAREWLGDLDWQPERVGTVWDIIALHTSRGIARHKSPEANYANQGISLDIRGVVPSGLDADDVRGVLDDWPRASFPDAMADAIVAEVRARPATTRSTWMEHIALAEIEGMQRHDFIAELRATTDFV